MKDFIIDKKPKKNSYILIGWLLVILQIIALLTDNQINYYLENNEYSSLAGYLFLGVMGMLFLIVGYKNKKEEKDIKNK